MIARHRRAASRIDRLVAIGFGAVALVVQPPAATRLRSIGVALVIASIVAAALTFATV